MLSTHTYLKSASLGESTWPVYSLYGLKMASDFPFANRFVEGEGDPDVIFTCVTEAPPYAGWEQSAPTFASSARIENGESLLYLYRQPGYDVLHFTEVADFYLWPERIVCHLLDPAYDYSVEIYLLGLVFSFWLERRGIPAMHAAATVVQGRAVAFLATNAGGKSSVAATLMQAGYPLLTDDILPLMRTPDTFVGCPGYPQMRMWPDQAEHFLGHYERLERVHPALSKRRVPVGEGGLGTFYGTACPLFCFYLPSRRSPEEAGTEIEILPVSSRNAVIELVRNSFTTRLLEAAGLQPQRLNTFAQIAKHVPMRRIIYPSGVEHLPRVCQAILDDLGRT